MEEMQKSNLLLTNYFMINLYKYIIKSCMNFHIYELLSKISTHNFAISIAKLPSPLAGTTCAMFLASCRTTL